LVVRCIVMTPTETAMLDARAGVAHRRLFHQRSLALP
jgi:hypothetical protein